MELLLLRHGPAERKSDWQGDDEERPLSAEGTALVTDVAGSLARHHTFPELILTSPYTRARQTAQIVAACLHAEDRVAVEKHLAPGFGPKQLGRLLKEHSDCQKLMLVAHDPDLTEILRLLTGGGRMALRKAGVAQVEVPDPQVLKGRLVSLLVPASMSTGQGEGRDGAPGSASPLTDAD